MRNLKTHTQIIVFIIFLSSCNSYHENKFTLSDIQGRLVYLDSVDMNNCILPQNINTISRKHTYGIALKINKKFYSDRKQKKLSLGVQRGLNGTEETLDYINIYLCSKSNRLDVTNLLYSNYTYGKLSKLFFKEYRDSYTNNCINSEYFNDISDFINHYNSNTSKKILGEALRFDIIFLLESDSISKYIKSDSVSIKIGFKTHPKE